MEKELMVNNVKLSPIEQENLRKKIIRVAKKNLKPNEKPDVKKVSEICECSVNHVKITWRKYQKGGISAIKIGKRGRSKGDGCKLNPEQEKEIQKLIVDNNPDQLKLKGFLWDRRLVAELILRKYGVKMPLSTMGYYLAKWGFTAQRPKKQHYKQNPKEVQHFLENEYPQIAQKAREDDAEIYWIDETGIHNSSNYVKGYSPKGKTPVVPVASEHIRINMISAITNKGKLRFHFYKEKMNQDLYIDFLTKLIKSTPKKVYAIADNLSVHHGLIVQEWAELNSDLITLFYLPSYSPKLNPDEYLNNNLKQKMAKKGYCKDENEIKSNALSAMREIQNTKDRVASFFEHDDVKYAKN